MSDTDIADRMRKWATVLSIPSGPFVNEDCAEAADTITRLAARVKELEGTLKPFADAAGRYDPVEKDDEVTAWDWAPTIGMLRRARAVLSASQPTQKKPAHE